MCTTGCLYERRPSLLLVGEVGTDVTVHLKRSSALGLGLRIPDLPMREKSLTPHVALFPIPKAHVPSQHSWFSRPTASYLHVRAARCMSLHLHPQLLLLLLY